MITPFMTFNDLMDDALAALQATGFPVYAGAIAAAMLEVQNQYLANFYNTLDFNLTMAYLSTASGSFVDLIGALLQCTRQSLESDSNYKYRIANQLDVLADCNQTALRIQLLLVSGVRDVIMQRFTNGSGSFSICIIPTATGPVDPALLAAAQSVIDTHEGYGINGQVLAADMISVDIAINLVLSGNVNASSVSGLVSQAVWNLIANLDAGQTLVYDQISQAIMNASTSITGFSIASFDVDNLPMFLVDQQAAWYEVFYPNLITVS